MYCIMYCIYYCVLYCNETNLLNFYDRPHTGSVFNSRVWEIICLSITHFPKVEKIKATKSIYSPQTSQIQAVEEGST